MSHWQIEQILTRIRSRKYGQSWSKWSTKHGVMWRSHTMTIAG